MTTSIDDILNGPGYFTCDRYHGCRLSFEACVKRQDEAEAAYRVPGRVATDVQFAKCVDCPQGKKNREETNMAKKGICINCGKERTLPANDKCARCNGYIYKRAKKESGVRRKPGRKPKDQKPAAPATREQVALAPEKVEEIKTRIRTAAAEKKAAKGIRVGLMTKPEVVAQDKAAFAAHMAQAKDERLLVILDFTLTENKHLLEPWTAYCRKNFRRSPGDQAMQLIEETLKAASAI